MVEERNNQVSEWEGAIHDEFPFGGQDEYIGKKFKGNNRCLTGYKVETTQDVLLGAGRESEMFIPVGTKYLEIHFDVEEVSIEDGEINKVVKTMRKGAEDLLDLSKQMDRKRFRNIDLIVGTTNPRLAKLAVRKLGFHYAGTDVVIEAQHGKKEKKLDTSVTIYTTKNELQANSEKLREMAARLRNR